MCGSSTSGGISVNSKPHNFGNMIAWAADHPCRMKDRGARVDAAKLSPQTRQTRQVVGNKCNPLAHRTVQSFVPRISRIAKPQTKSKHSKSLAQANEVLYKFTRSSLGSLVAVPVLLQAEAVCEQGEQGYFAGANGHMPTSCRLLYVRHS